MIPWWVALITLVLGDLMGIIVMAILYGNTNKKAEKKNRQRGNADGSKGGVL